MDAVTLQINRLTSFPKKHQVTFADVRKAVIKDFPYVVIYEVKNGLVVILSVFHFSRNPDDWKKRLP